MSIVDSYLYKGSESVLPKMVFPTGLLWLLKSLCVGFFFFFFFCLKALSILHLFPGIYHLRGFSDVTTVKNPPANAGDSRDTGSIPGLGRSSGVGNGNPLQYFCLANSVDRGVWWATIHGGPKKLDMTEHSCLHIYYLRK